MAVFELLSFHVHVPRQFACVCHSFNMEWCVKENHVAVIALHNCGKSHSQIFTLKPIEYFVNVHLSAIKHYKELSRVERQDSFRTPENWEG